MGRHGTISILFIEPKVFLQEETQHNKKTALPVLIEHYDNL
jgi:hypothetical protein